MAGKLSDALRYLKEAGCFFSLVLRRALHPQKSGLLDYSEQIIYEMRKPCEVYRWVDSAVRKRLSNDFSYSKERSEWA